MNKSDFTILHSNIRGLKSKMASLKSHINNIKPNIVTLNEHGMTGKSKINIDNYLTFSKNRKDKIMGGVST